MEYVRLARGLPAGLRDPALVVAFTGWGDAGSAASSAALLLLRGRRLFGLADLDPEAFYVLASTRPLLRESPEGRRIRWPSLSLLAGRAPDDGERDLVVLVAAEPQLRWRSLARAISETWLQLGGGPAVLLGAFLSEALHVGPVPLFGSGSTPYLGLLLRALKVAPSGFGGPTTAIMPIYEALATRGTDGVHLWAALPHYLAPLPNPKATAALVRVVSRLLGLKLDISDLERAASAFETRIDQGIPWLGRRPESARPGAPAIGPAGAGSASASPLPTGEEAIREVERLLGLEPRSEGPEAEA